MEDEPITETDVVEDVVVQEEALDNPVDKNWKQAQHVMAEQKREIEELKSMMYQMAQAKKEVEEEPEEDDFDDADDDEYVTVAKAKKIADKAKRTAEKYAYEAARNAFNQHLREQNLTVTQEKAREKYEDYDEIIKNYTVPLIQKDPALAHKINSSKNPAETAYRLGKISDEYMATENTRVSPRAEKIVKNNQRPSSSHSGQSLKTQVSAVTSNMSPADIWAQAQEYASAG